MPAQSRFSFVVASLASRVLDRRAHKVPPLLETRLRRFPVPGGLEARIAEQDRVKRLDDLAAMGERPFEGVRVLEFAVLRVWAVGREPDAQAAGRHVALGLDVIAGEDLNGCARGRSLRDAPKHAIFQLLSGERLLDRRA